MYKIAFLSLGLFVLMACPVKQNEAAPAATAGKGANPVAGTGAGQISIADLFAQKDALTNKPVTLQGKVVKFNANIMGSNWIHIRDGSGGAGTNDLTLTTKGTAKVGDTVKVSGALTRAKDFGAGYKFDVIIEDAQIEVQ